MDLAIWENFQSVTYLAWIKKLGNFTFLPTLFLWSVNIRFLQKGIKIKLWVHIILFINLQPPRSWSALELFFCWCSFWEQTTWILCIIYDLEYLEFHFFFCRFIDPLRKSMDLSSSGIVRSMELRAFVIGGGCFSVHPCCISECKLHISMWTPHNFHPK